MSSKSKKESSTKHSVSQKTKKPKKSGYSKSKQTPEIVLDDNGEKKPIQIESDYQGPRSVGGDRDYFQDSTINEETGLGLSGLFLESSEDWLSRVLATNPDYTTVTNPGIQEELDLHTNDVLFLGNISFLDQTLEDNVQFLPTCQTVLTTGYRTSTFGCAESDKGVMRFDSELHDSFELGGLSDLAQNGINFGGCANATTLDDCLSRLVGMNFDLKPIEDRELEAFAKTRANIELAISEWETQPLAYYSLDKIRNEARSKLVAKPPARYRGGFNMPNSRFHHLGKYNDMVFTAGYLSSTFRLVQRNRYSSIPMECQGFQSSHYPPQITPGVHSASFCRSSLGTPSFSMGFNNGTMNCHMF